MKNKQKKLPARIFVVREVEGPDEWFTAEASHENIWDGAQVGVYELVETKTQKVTKELI
jgi:hypothetical protein